jgi:hypothetical protein
MIVIRHQPRITYHVARGSCATLHTIRCAAGTVSAHSPAELAAALYRQAQVWRKRWPGVSDALVSVAHRVRFQGVP